MKSNKQFWTFCIWAILFTLSSNRNQFDQFTQFRALLFYSICCFYNLIQKNDLRRTLITGFYKFFFVVLNEHIAFNEATIDAKHDDKKIFLNKVSKFESRMHCCLSRKQCSLLFGHLFMTGKPKNVFLRHWLHEKIYNLTRRLVHTSYLFLI